MLKRNRKPLSSKLDAINRTETLCKNIINIVNDDNKIPKRKKAIIGNRLVDKVLSCYEDARYANLIEVTDTATMKERISFEKKAEKEALDLCSDLRLLPCAVTESPTAKWIVHTQEESYNCYKLINKWRESDEKRFEKFKKYDPFEYVD